MARRAPIPISLDLLVEAAEARRWPVSHPMADPAPWRPTLRDRLRGLAQVLLLVGVLFSLVDRLA